MCVCMYAVCCMLYVCAYASAETVKEKAAWHDWEPVCRILRHFGLVSSFMQASWPARLTTTSTLELSANCLHTARLALLFTRVLSRRLESPLPR
ncbi:hypothetical protein F4801DRAFT_117257 [Xylaria longipes]|nr:hypothetical protein F4801DRAFT_117257 [Xylaria longipes]